MGKSWLLDTHGLIWVNGLMMLNWILNHIPSSVIKRGLAISGLNGGVQPRDAQSSRRKSGCHKKSPWHYMYMQKRSVSWEMMNAWSTEMIANDEKWMAYPKHGCCHWKWVVGRWLYIPQFMAMQMMLWLHDFMKTKPCQRINDWRAPCQKKWEN